MQREAARMIQVPRYIRAGLSLKSLNLPPLQTAISRKDELFLTDEPWHQHELNPRCGAEKSHTSKWLL